MSTTETEYLDKLSTGQREKLLMFVDQTAQIIGKRFFDQYDAWTDAEILALSLRAAQILGYENESLEKLFRHAFGIADVTRSPLGDWLAFIILVDTERRILLAAGGRN
jgi:hypothetical protein